MLAAIKQLMYEVISSAITAEEPEGPLADERRMLTQAKKLGLFAAGAASQKYMQSLADQQEVMAAIANCVIEVYAIESCILRAEKLVAGKGEAAASAAIAVAKFYAAKAMRTVEVSARKVVAAIAEGDMLRTQMAIVRRLAKHDFTNTIALGRQIANHVVAAGRYSI